VTVPFVVTPIVEGHGEVEAVPVLLRRIVSEIDPNRTADVRGPIRVKRQKVTHDGELERYAQLAGRSSGDGGAVLVLLDADDDCPAELGPALLARSAAVTRCPVAVVLALREFEAWFLAAAESLGGRRGLPEDMPTHPDPEAIHDAKGWIQQHRTDGFAYSPVTDQPALAGAFDLATARAGAKSFDKLWRDIERLMHETTP
jgi:hypothetical protein